MSMIDQYGQRVILGAPGRDPLLTLIRQHYAQENPRVWRALALFALKESLGWTVDQCALAFEINRGQVSRSVQATRRELRRRFDYVPDRRAGFTDPDDPLDNPDADDKWPAD